MGIDSVEILGEEIYHLEGSSASFFVKREKDTITVDAVKEALDAVMDFIEDLLRINNCTEKTITEVHLAVEEVYINICSYAYKPEDKNKRVTCRVSVDKSFVSIWFSDTGIPFDPLKMKDPDVTGKQFQEKVGGFGIYLVKKVMDEVSYKYQDGMNILNIKRFFDN